MLSVTLEPKARIGTNGPARSVPKDPDTTVRPEPATRNIHVLKIIYPDRGCLVDTDLTKMPD
ncbi:hypothetical protein ACIRQY_13265 [Streptomyces sp. NPDC101490]|uniref:hypothetical protein n=1 Tax=unclassified Streptomyces TaxID=2593676 RepID=UPI00332119CE